MPLRAMRSALEKSFRVALILTVCGGYLDAFTWLAHDRVLANTQTANVVLFGVYAATGEWGEALKLSSTHFFRLHPRRDRGPQPA